MASCIILGAGMAGLTAATVLQKEGISVTVIDKGRGVGGRMATRRIGSGGKADHGAQFYSMRSAEWTHWNETWIQEGIVAPWFTRADHPRMIGTAGMSSIPKKMAESLSVITQERIIEIRRRSDAYEVVAESGRHWMADSIVLTFPAPQAFDLLRHSNLGLVHQEVLQSIQYAPCHTVMAVLDQASDIQAPGGFTPENGPIGWIADNQKKGISPIPTITIQATPEYSEANLERSLDEVKEELLRQAAQWIGNAQVVESTIHRWRYSLAIQKYPHAYFHHEELPGLYLGGDGFGEGHIEAAFVSGHRIAHAMIGK